MTPETVQALADYLASVDADWRASNGYTGRPVHRREYWRNMAARILADSVKNVPKKRAIHCGQPADKSTPACP